MLTPPSIHPPIHPNSIQKSISKIFEKVEILRKNPRIISLTTKRSSQNNYDNCFGKHGNKYSLKLRELMNYSKYTNLKTFKEELIKNNIIKNDFTYSNSVYRLTEEQKNQFIIDFNKFNQQK